MTWIQRRPLHGQTVLVTRPARQAEALADPLRELGATVLIQPAIEISPPDDWSEVDRTIADLPAHDVIVFCSDNGVRFFISRLLELGKDTRWLAETRIAAVGSKTAAALGEYHLRADIVPPDFRAESLGAQLAEDAQGKRMAVIRASRGRDVLAAALERAGAIVSQVIAYRHTDVVRPDPAIIQLANQGKVDWITITSSATARSVAAMFGDSLREMKIASLSPVTSQTIARLGYQVTAEADPYTIDALVHAITETLK